MISRTRVSLNSKMDLDEFAFLAGDEAPLFALDDDVLDFAFEIFRLLHGRPAAEPLPETREEAGVCYSRPRPCLTSELPSLVTHVVFHGLHVPGEFQAAVQKILLMAGDPEKLGGIGHRLIVVEFLAGKDVQAEVAPVGEGVNADVTFSDEHKARKPPVLRHFAVILEDIRRHDLGHMDQVRAV